MPGGHLLLVTNRAGCGSLTARPHYILLACAGNVEWPAWQWIQARILLIFTSVRKPTSGLTPTPCLVVVRGTGIAYLYFGPSQLIYTEQNAPQSPLDTGQDRAGTQHNVSKAVQD
jgi:hypothetical protein